jgi:serine/threonine-protein kinase RsbW
MALCVNRFRPATRTPRFDMRSHMVRTVAGNAADVAQLRGEFTQWLQRHFHLNDQRRSDLALAVNEALINAAEFGHPDRFGQGIITFHAAYDETVGTLTVTIGDHGRWRLRLTRTAAEQSVKRGHGIALMQILTDELRISPSVRGTQVSLVWTNVPPRYLVLSPG